MFLSHQYLLSVFLKGLPCTTVVHSHALYSTRSPKFTTDHMPFTLPHSIFGLITCSAVSARFTSGVSFSWPPPGYHFAEDREKASILRSVAGSCVLACSTCKAIALPYFFAKTATPQTLFHVSVPSYVPLSSPVITRSASLI